MPQDLPTKKRDIFLDFDTHLTPPGGKSWFFGIGINEYAHFTPLLNAVKDVQDIVQVLQGRYDLLPEQTLTLYNKEATRKNIISMLDRLQREVGPQDKLVIYYSGHGYLNKEIGKGYWIPTNAERDNTAAYIRNSTIREYIETLKARHTLLISDSCFSGSLFVRGTSRSGAAINELESLPSRWALCSGRHNEEVFDGEPGKNSPFAESIIDTLKRNQTKEFNVAKLADRVVEQTRSNYQQLPEGNPLFGVGHKGGQYIFRLKANEVENWAFAKKEGSLAAFQQFLANHPEGQYAEKAREQISTLEEDTAWNKAIQNNSVAAFIQYRKEYPEGRYMEQALEAIQKLEEDQTWKIAKRRDNIFDYEKYLEEFPKGINIEEAKKRLVELKANSKNEKADSKLKEVKQRNPVANKSASPESSKPPVNKKSFLQRKWPVVTAATVVVLLTVYALGGFNGGSSFPTGTVSLGDKVYKTVTIDGLTWLAENMDYKTKEGSEYFKNNQGEMIREDGRLYTKEAAEEACSTLGMEWRLPTKEDWELLTLRFGGYTFRDSRIDGGAVVFKKGENKPLFLNGSSGFDAGLGGIRYGDGKDVSSRRESNNSFYWSSTRWEGNIHDPYYLGMELSNNRVKKSDFEIYYKDAGLSCRCVKGTNSKALAGKTRGVDNEDPDAPTVGTKGVATLGERTYKTIRLNDLTWMAENLDYDKNIRGGEYYLKLTYESQKSKYGLIYPWPEGKRLCEEFGWRLPTNKETDALVQQFGGPDKAYASLIHGGKSGFNGLLGGVYNEEHGNKSMFGEKGLYLVTDTEFPDKMLGFVLDGTDQTTSYVERGRIGLRGACRCVKE